MSEDRKPDLLIERAALGELPASEADDAELKALEKSNDSILDRYPPRIIAPQIERRLDRAKKSEAPPIKWWHHFAIGVPVAAAAALLMLVVPMGPGPGDPGIRLKGGAQLVVQRPTTSDGRESLKDGSSARAGDQLQLGYRVSNGRALHGVVISVDGAGAVTAHLPTSGSAPILESNTLRALPHSYVLDDAPEFERFFLVTSPEPFELERVMTAARALAKSRERRTGTLRLPRPFSQTSVLLRKE